MVNKQVNLFDSVLKNPVIAASGTFGFGYEMAEFFDINCLGSISLKGSTLNARYGNPLPRIAECPDGLINAIGLQNPGIDAVINNELPKLNKVYKDKVILNIGGHSIEEYLLAVEKCNGLKNILGIELNISCPNVQGGGLAFGIKESMVEELTAAVKKISDQKIIVKLSPNVTDICALAKAAENGGADAISLINTLIGMRIDIKTGKPIISVKKGGYSGRGVFPVALRMVYDVFDTVKIPIIGMGGISSPEEVIEMLMAGASAVMVGTATLKDPFACKNIIEGLDKTMAELKITDLSTIIGRAHK
ncbi:dihydroorotate dehydrogenase [bacterium]|nr:dihydroorotate dehydrogenase [bacterium]